MTAMITCNTVRETSLSVYILIIVFAMSSWIDVNGVWTELPIMVNYLPERWNLPSYLVLICQCANIGPLVFTVLNRLAPGTVKELPVIYIILVIGFISCILLGFFWDTITNLFGDVHSTGLFVLCAVLAIVDCTSSVVYLPYMASYKPQYLSALFIGEGFSGLVPGIMGIIQGGSGDPECVNQSTTTTDNYTGLNTTSWAVYPTYASPKYSVDVFFFITAGLFVCSTAAFTVLHFAPFSDSARVETASTFEPNETICAFENMLTIEDGVVSLSYMSHRDLYSVQTGTFRNSFNGDIVPWAPFDDDTLTVIQKESMLEAEKYLRSGHFIFMMTLVFWISALLLGVLTSTQSYSALSYGNLAYSLHVRLSLLANPLACLFALFVITHSVGVISLLTLVGTGLAAYQVTLAALSPSPPLQNETVGVVLTVTTGVLVTAVFCYARVAIASAVSVKGGHDALLWWGVTEQAGALCGAIATFVAINTYHALQSAPPCPT